MTQHDSSRSLLRISGEDRIHFLQGILTQDVNALAEARIQFAALLSPQGKILHDMFLVDQGESLLIDSPTIYKDTLRKRLTLYKLRAKVMIEDVSETWQVGYAADGGLPDPRHPALPHRIYFTGDAPALLQPVADYRIQCLALGIPDSIDDFAPDAIVALDAGYDLLHAISFTKGCYVGQEVTARMHYKSINRRAFYQLTDANGSTHLALLRFDDIEQSHGHITVDNVDYRATLPAWLTPKFEQFTASKNNQ